MSNMFQNLAINYLMLWICLGKYYACASTFSSFSICSWILLICRIYKRTLSLWPTLTVLDLKLFVVFLLHEWLWNNSNLLNIYIYIYNWILGHRKGRSLLIDDGALTWMVEKSTAFSTSTRRHIELALCHLAQNGIILTPSLVF